MANEKISQLTSGNPAQSDDLIPIARSGSNYSVTAGSVADLGGGSPGGSNGQLQGNDNGDFGGVPGSVCDFTNGLLTLAPPEGNSGSATLTIIGGALEGDLQDWFIYEGAEPIDYIDQYGNLYLGTGVGLYAALVDTVALTLTGALTDSNGSTGTSGWVLQSTGGAVIWAAGGGGGGTVNSGTEYQLAVYPSTGTLVQGDPLLTDNGTALTYTGSGGLTLGTQASVNGLLTLQASGGSGEYSTIASYYGEGIELTCSNGAFSIYCSSGPLSFEDSNGDQLKIQYFLEYLTVTTSGNVFVLKSLGGQIAAIDFSGIYYSGTTPGVSEGPYSAITSIQTVGGIVTVLADVSDEALKNHSPYVGGLTEVLSINPIKYTWNEEGQKITKYDKDRTFVGFRAQDVQKAIPEAVTQSKSHPQYLGFDDRPIIAALVNAVKELSAKIDKLENAQRQ